jgi:hypothetical protein
VSAPFITDPVRLLTLRSAVAAGAAAAALTSYALACDDDELPTATDECLNILLQATLAALDAGGILDGEEERAALRAAIVAYVGKPDEADVMPNPGRCRICGCTETSACVGIPLAKGVVGACSWADSSRTLCTNPDCLEKAGVAAPEPELTS